MGKCKMLTAMRLNLTGSYGATFRYTRPDLSFRQADTQTNGANISTDNRHDVVSLRLIPLAVSTACYYSSVLFAVMIFFIVIQYQCRQPPLLSCQQFVPPTRNILQPVFVDPMTETSSRSQHAKDAYSCSLT